MTLNSSSPSSPSSPPPNPSSGNAVFNDFFPTHKGSAASPEPPVPNSRGGSPTRHRRRRYHTPKKNPAPDETFFFFWKLRVPQRSTNAKLCRANGNSRHVVKHRPVPAPNWDFSGGDDEEMPNRRRGTGTGVAGGRCETPGVGGWWKLGGVHRGCCGFGVAPPK